MSSRSAPLRELSPLRTVRESFPSYGSSNSKLLFVILWREFEAEIPEDTARQAALRLLPLCRGVLEKYDLTDDFADTPDYELFYTELTGTVQILLEDGIQ